jgi:tripartite-type tricarboxylate transporter receptor subunit TctC
MAVAVLGISGLVATACGGGGGGQGGTGVKYPERRIEMVVPYPAGGATDSLARIWAKCFEGELGQTVTVVNREGGQGGVGSASVAGAKPDGYTLEIAPESPLMVLPELVKDVGYTYERFDYVATLGYSPDVFYVSADSKFQSINDLVAALRSGGDAPRPAQYSPAASSRMRADSMAANNNFPWGVIPYDSAADVAQSVVSGDAGFSYSGISIPMLEQLKAGKLRLLAAATDISVIQKGVPTLESAGLKGFAGPDADVVYLAGPAALPAEVVGVLEKAVNTCRVAPGVKDALPVQLLPAEGTTGDALDKSVPEVATAYRDYLATRTN